MASRGVNKVIIMGNLGQDPEVKYTNSGSAVANITVATSDSWRDKSTGEKREKTEWHRIVLFGKTAEVAGEYLRKGSQVYIEGQLQTRKWQDQSGQDRYTTEVVVQYPVGQMQMLGGKGNGQQPHQGGWGQPQQPQAQPQQQRPETNAYPSNNEPNNSAAQHHPQHQPQYNEPPMDFDDDIPFRVELVQRNGLAFCV